MKACSTNVARSMGFLAAPSKEEEQFKSPVTIMGPMTGSITSYHQGGLSNKELWKLQKTHRDVVRREFRL